MPYKTTIPKYYVGVIRTTGKNIGPTNQTSPPYIPPAAYADVTASSEANHIQPIPCLTSCPQEEDTGLSEQGLQE